MEYPLQLELDISQDDYIEVEILEQELEAQLWKKSVKKTFYIQTAVCLVVLAIVAFVSFKEIITKETIYLVPFIWIFFRLHFVYNYKWGVKKEFDLAVTHLLKNKDTHTFFTPEKGMAFFYEDRCEFLTNEQRRYFGYDLIKNIKIIRHLYIFVMKRSKEKGLQGFAYMVIPKRNLTEDRRKRLDEICAVITDKYNLEEWVESEIFG